MQKNNDTNQVLWCRLPGIVWTLHPAFEHADRLPKAVSMAQPACPGDHLVSRQMVEVRVARELLESDTLV